MEVIFLTAHMTSTVTLGVEGGGVGGGGGYNKAFPPFHEKDFLLSNYSMFKIIKSES